VLYLLLAFADKNPGITRVLLGDALVGEQERLHSRVEQFFARIETQFRQILREAVMREGEESRVDIDQGASLMLALVEGRMQRFLRTRFRVSPLAEWDGHWELIAPCLFPGAD
ncbi:MAG: nucleoid occlusion factor SlmA, partial [Gammaproteobacteria bacterium]|nr:nucleoid occlusion factor SlmA [Gammaproteobacteria bacterium]